MNRSTVLTGLLCGSLLASGCGGSSGGDATPPPSAPAGVTAIGGDGQATVSWTASSGATSYNVYYSTSASVSKTSGTKVAGAASGGAVTGLANGVAYHFVVTAVNLGGESAESSPAATATPLPPIPAAPTGVVASSGDGQATVSWTASSGATSYNVYYSTSASVSTTSGTKVAGAVSGGAVTGLANGVAYHFVVTAVNLGGESAESSPVATATPLPPIPAPPTGVAAVAGDGRVTVSWSASSGATSYNLYYSTSASVSKGNGTRVAGAVSGGAVTGLANGSPYYFVVTAENLGGESAESSPVATATPLPPIPPPPTGVAAAAGDGQATVSWAASSGATSYNLYYSTSPSVSKGNGTRVAGAVSGGAVTGLANGSPYYFVVTAENLGGESAESSPVATATLVPAPPTSVSAAAGNGQAAVSWAASSGATSYNLYYSTSPGVSKAAGTKVTGAVSGGAVTGLANGSTFFFVVTAANAGGESVESSPAATATLVPSPPTGVSAAAGEGQATVSWAASSGATSYNVYYSTSAGVSKTNGTRITGAASGSAIAGLASGATYWFAVTAVNAGGESAESSPAATATLVPAPPTSVSAAAGDGRATVSWTASSGATSYNLYWSTSATVSKTSGTKVTGALSGGAVTGLANGTTYYFVVTAVNAGGEGAESVPAATARPLPPIPAAPTGVLATAGDGVVTVTWSASSGATSYNVYFSTSAAVSKATGEKLGGVSSGVTVGPLTNGTAYWFVVTAENLGGESAESSPPATATPLPPIPEPPLLVTATPGDGEATVSWIASTGASSYNLYWSTSATVSKTSGTKVTGALSGGAVTGLANGTTYWFVVTAVSLGGESAESVPAAAATLVPAPPTGVSAVAGDAQATISWTRSSGATSYNLYYSASATVSKTTGTKVAGAASGGDVTGLTNGTTYYFVVTAVNAGGESAESGPAASAKPLPPIPAAPAGVSAVSGDGQVTVSWTASPGATSYNLYYSTSASVSKATGTQVAGATSGGAVTGLANGTAYYFVVTAVNLGGESVESAPAVSATPLPPIPAAPIGVTAAMGLLQARVSWTASSGATSYNVYYSTSPSVSKATGTQVAGAVSGGVIAGLTPGSSYYFVVTAVNLSGESVESSPAGGTALPAIIGSVAYSGAGNVDMAVDSARRWVYISGSIRQSGLIRINASIPTSMTRVVLPYGGGIAADSQTGSHATTNGASTLVVYDVNNSLSDTKTLSGCAGTMDSDSTTGRFFVSSQCGDHLAVYSEGTKSLIANIASNGVGSSVVFDPSTGNVFQNLTPNNAVGAVAPLAVTPSYTTSVPFTGFVRAAGGGRLYVSANNGDFLVLDSSSYATLHTFPGTSVTAVAADIALGLFYVASGSAITVYDATSYAALTSITLPVTIQNMRMAPNDDRFYVVGGGQFFVIQTRGNRSGPATPTGVSASMGLAQARVSWTASPGATSYNVYYSTQPFGGNTKVLGVVSGGVIAGLTPGTTYYFKVSAVDSTGESVWSQPAAVGTPLPAILGKVAYSGAGNVDMAVDSTLKRVYISGNIGQSGLIRLDASNPTGMTQVSLPYGGGIAVDSQTGRYGTTDGTTLYVYDPNDTAYDTKGLLGCPGTMDSDSVTGRFFVSSQCGDHLAVYGEGTKSLAANIASNGVGSSVVFDPSTGNVFQNLTPNYAKGSVIAPLVVSPTYTTSAPFTGFVRAAGGGRLYVSANNGDFLVLDSSTYATLRTFPATSVSAVAADIALGVFYVSSGSTITVYDATSWAALASITLPVTIQNLRMAPGDDRLYVVGGGQLFVIQTRANGPGPATPTSVSASPGNQQAWVSWTASSGATSYNVYYSTSPSVSEATGTKILGAVNGAAITGLTNGATYYFVVTAVDSTGESAESGVVSMAPRERVMVLLGYDTTNYGIGTAQIYDSLTNSWGPTTTIPAPNPYASSNPGVVVLTNGQVMVAGGGAGDNRSTTNAVRLWAPATDSWAYGPSMVHDRNGFALLTLADGTALAAGGCAGGCSGPSSRNEYVATVGPTSERFNASWASQGNLTTLRAGLAYPVQLPDSRVMVCGGNDSGLTSYSSCEFYQPSSGTWSASGVALPDVGSRQMLLVGTKVLTLDQTGTTSYYWDSAADSTFTHAATLPSPQPGGRMTLLGDGRVMLAGGYVNGGAYPGVTTVQIWSPTTNSWTPTAPMIIGRAYPAIATLRDGRVFVAGGNATAASNAQPLNSGEIWDPAAPGWTPTSPMSTPRNSPTGLLLK